MQKIYIRELLYESKKWNMHWSPKFKIKYWTSKWALEFKTSTKIVGWFCKIVKPSNINIRNQDNLHKKWIWLYTTQMLQKLPKQHTSKIDSQWNEISTSNSELCRILFLCTYFNLKWRLKCIKMCIIFQNVCANIQSYIAEYIVKSWASDITPLVCGLRKSEEHHGKYTL